MKEFAINCLAISIVFVLGSIILVEFAITAILLTEYNFWYGVLSSAITLMTIAGGIQFGGYILSKYD